MKFSWKIFLTTILIVCCTFSIGGMILMSSWLQQFLEREIQFAESQNMMLNGALRTASRLLPPEDYRDIHAVAERVLSSVLDKSREQVPVQVADEEERSLYQTPAFAGYESAFQDVSEQQSGYVILSEDGGYRIHFISHWKLGSGVYTLETVRDITGVFETRDAQYRLFIRLTVGMTCITGVLVLLLSKWLTKPIRSLSRAARKMAKGDYGVRALGKGQDEVGMLAEDFNRMAEALEHKMDQLKEALRRQEIDQLGLDAIDRRMLTTIIRNYGGGPVGLETLAAAIGEESVTLEDVYEPYLMQIGFLSRTPRGRCATPLAYEHLGLTPNGRPQPAPEADQLSLLEGE